MGVAGIRYSSGLSIIVLGLGWLLALNPVSAQPVEVPPTWGGDFWSRPRFTGDWDGLRDELGQKGIVLDIDLLLTPQDVMAGGRNTGGVTWGNADYTLNVDTGKLGLWPGGFFKVSGDSGFGSNAFNNAGALIPVNTAALIPASNDETSALMNATMMQFLSPQFGMVAGKINFFDPALIGQEFYGDYFTQFLNTAFMFPMTLEEVPISSFGGGVIALPTKDIALSALVVGADGTPTSNNLHDAFDGGVTMVGTGKLTINPFDLLGHQNIGFSWSNKERFRSIRIPPTSPSYSSSKSFPALRIPGPS